METLFQKSDNLDFLAKALSIFQGDVKAVSKDGSNPFFKSKYATLQNVIETTSEPLKKVGLSLAQFPIGENQLVSILMHESGQYIQATVKMTPKGNTPQDLGSAITYMRRYSIASILRLATEEDDDGNAASKPGKRTPSKDDIYSEAVSMIESNKTESSLLTIGERVSNSDKFTTAQKEKLTKMISDKIDSLESQAAPAPKKK